MMKGNNGSDIFFYFAPTDSPLTLANGAIDAAYNDKITSFQVGTDKIDLSAFGFGGAAASVLNKTTTTFSTSLSNGTGFFGTAGVAVEYASLNRVTTTRVYVDTDHNGSLDTGDMMIQLTGASRGALGATSVNF